MKTVLLQSPRTPMIGCRAGGCIIAHPIHSPGWMPSQYRSGFTRPSTSLAKLCLLLVLLSGGIHTAWGQCFGAATNFAVGMNPNSVAVGDVNGDSKPDIITANRFGHNVSVLLGDGMGSFGAATNFAVGMNPNSVAVGDVNGDSKPDIITANLNSDNVSVLLGTGTGSFGAVTNFAVDGGPNSVAVGDVNGDSKPDIITANRFGHNVSVLLGDGTGSFGAATNFAVGMNPNSVAVGDVNEDGKLDIITANFNSTNVSVLLGTGTGNFGAATNFAVDGNPNSVAVGDVNEDGKPDIITANFSSDNVSVLLGTGTGSFGAATNFAVGNGPVWVAVGDVNGDSRPDIIAANASSNNVSVLLQGQGVGIAVGPVAGSAVCAGSAVQARVSVSGTPSAYQWFKDGALVSGQTSATLTLTNVTPASAGSYQVVVSSPCTSVTSTAFSLTVNAPPTVSLTNNGPITCAQTSVTLTATSADSGVSYSFSGPGVVSQTGNQAVVNAPGTYSVTLTNPTTGCFSTTTISIGQNSNPPSVSIDPTSATLTCANPVLTLTASSSAATLRWSTGATTPAISVTLTGTYSVTATAPNGCTAMDSATVTGNTTPPIASLSNNGPLSCVLTSVTLTASGGDSYRFSGEATQAGSGPTATVSTAGVYSVTVFSANGCSATATTSVSSNTALAAPTLLTQTGQAAVSVDLNTANVTLLASGCAGTIQWTGPDNTVGTGTLISVPTSQPDPLVYQAHCLLGTCISPPASATITVAGRLTVLHRDVDNYPTNNAIQPLLQLQNQGAGPMPLAAITLRYHLTPEAAPALGNLLVNYAQVGSEHVGLRYVPLEPAQPGAAGYVEVRFTAGAGSLAPGANSGPIQTYFTKSDYGSLDEVDDYSYNPVRDQLTANLRITAYYNGVLIAGIEPGTSPQIRAVRALTESKNGPSATQMNTFLEVRNEGTAGVNYGDLSARYYFTSDGAERLQVEVDEGQVQAQLVGLSPAVVGANYYLEIRFNPGGQLAPGGSTGTIRYRISKPDGGRFEQTNDHSYQEQPQTLTQNSRVVVYIAGERVWGREPGSTARLGSTEPGRELAVRVLGNPVVGSILKMEVRGAEGQPLRLQVKDVRGRLVSERVVERAGSVERQMLDLVGQSAGLLLLRVSTPSQSRTIKVLKAQ